MFERNPESGDTTGMMFSGTLSEKLAFLKEIWYNQLCSHQVATFESVDFATAEAKVEYKHCRELNPDGNCTYFAPKE